MTRALPKSPASLLARIVSLPVFLFFAGCYSDPNIPEGKRVQFPPGDEPPTAAVTSVTPPVKPSGQPVVPSPGESGGGKVAVGDSLTITFSDTPPLALPALTVVKVGGNGTFTLPFNVIIYALGKTPTELEREIRNAYVPYLFVNCTATVRPEERYFFVGGEVKVSSRQAHTSHSMTVLRAITTAGGFTDFAKKSRIEVRRANGTTEYVNYNKALKDPKLDLVVFPGDQIIVPRGL